LPVWIAHRRIGIMDALRIRHFAASQYTNSRSAPAALAIRQQRFRATGGLR
jgi:hypothetical protein